MNAVVQHEPVNLPAVSESAAIIQVIERAAMNPNVDIDKMERLLQMQERIMERTAKAAYAAALAEMQPSIPVISERGKIEVKDKESKRVIQSTGYALWEDINEAIKPVLAAHGFALSFRTGMTAEGKITVTGILSHREGHQEETMMVLPHDSTGSKNAVQAVGSSTSYGKRYTASALLNITSRGEDDDGNKGGAKEISEDQRRELEEIIAKAGIDVAGFCSWAQVDSLASISAANFGKAKQALETKAKAKGVKL